MEEVTFTISAAIRLVDTSEVVIVDGFNVHEIIDGAMATSLLPRLSQMAGATLSSQELYALWPDLPSDDIDDFISMMFARGIAEPLITKHQPDSESAHGRAIPAQKGVSVLFAEDSPTLRYTASAISALLKQEGLSADVVESFNRVQDLAAATTFAICLFDESTLKTTLEYDGALHRAGIISLYVHVSGDAERLIVGPLFRRNGQLCAKCLGTLLGDYPQTRVASSPPNLLTQDLIASIVSLATMERLLNETYVPDHLARVYELNTMSTTLLSWELAGRCNAHSSAINAVSRSTSDVHSQLYESQLSLRDFHPDTEDDGPLIPRRLLLNLPRASLPRGVLNLVSPVTNVLSGRSSTPSGPITASMLSSLLALGFGFVDRDNSRVRRWVPSAGNLGSCEGFVAVQGVDGVSDGIYYYNPNEHALRLVSQHPSALFGHMKQNLEVGQASVAVICVGAVGRLSNKYSIFAHKLVYLDAGATVAHVAVCCLSAGVRVKHMTPPRGDTVAAMLGLHASFDKVTHIIILESSTGALGSGRDVQVEPGLSQVSLLYALRSRRAHRTFSQRAIALETLEGAVRLALRYQVGPRTPTVWLLAQQLENRAAGIYKYFPERTAFTFVAEALAEDLEMSFYLNLLPHRPPAAFVLTCSAEPWSHGEAEYTSDVLNCGYVVQRLWLMAVSLGLTGCTIAGIDGTRTTVGHSWPTPDEFTMTAFVCGYEN